MTSTNEEMKTLKSDTKGRVRVPVERREELLNEFEGSGISAMRFAKLAGVKYATFANWRQKRRKTRAQVPESGVGGTAPGERAGLSRPVRLFEAYAEVGRNGVTGGGGLMIELLGRARVVVESPAQLRMVAELIGMLGPTPRPPC